jgi:formate/nitrite transporter
VLAGAFIGFGGMMLLLVKADQSLSFAPSSLLGGIGFSIGLFAVVTAGAELFTGNNLMTIGMMSGRYGPMSLLRSWALVYAGNLAGSVIVAAILHGCGFAHMGAGSVGEALSSVAVAKCSLPMWTMVARGIMCNLLVCLAVWMSFAGRSVADKFLATLVPVTAFVACGFEHCVANMMILPFAMMEGTGVTLGQVVMNVAVVTVGNMIGGAVLFAGAYWLAFGEGGKDSGQS